MNQTEQIRQFATYYAKNGLSTIPLKPKGKSPVINTWTEWQRARASEAQIDKWWKTHPTANVGIVTGKISDLIVVDIDGPTGEQSFKEHLSWLPDTMEVQTGGGGRHLYFKSHGIHFPCVVGLYEGIDIRADGGLVVAPPSVHKTGGLYSFENKLQPIRIPNRLVKVLQERGQKEKLTDSDWEAVITKGGRDEHLTRLAGKLLGKAEMPVAVVLATLQAWNLDHCNPPLPDAQVRKIVQSIGQREKNREKTKEQEGARFTVRTQDDMAREHGDIEVPWIIEDWLPDETCALIVAPPGTYKTWLLLNLARAISTGEDFLGMFPVLRTGPVLFIQQEDPWSMLQSRLGSMFGIKEDEVTPDGVYTLDCKHVDEFMNAPIYWYTDRALNFKNQDTMDLLEEEIKTLKPVMVVIDPLYTATGVEGYMSEGAQDMLRLKQLRDDYRVSFVIAHHTNKSSSKTGSSSRMDMWGSQFLNAWLETGWQIREGSGSTSIKIRRHFKQSGMLDTLQLSFDITDYDFKVEAEGITTGEKIASTFMAGQEYESMSEIAKVMGCSKTYVHKVLKAKGIIKVDGVYTIPEGGFDSEDSH